MKYHWSCGCSFEWDEAEDHYNKVLTMCGDYCDLRIDKQGAHDPHPCLDHTVYSKEVNFEVNMVFGPEFDPIHN